jgi:hypothetical protein
MKTFRTATVKDFKVGARLYTARAVPVVIIGHKEDGYWYGTRFGEVFEVFESEKDLYRVQDGESD